MDLGPVDRITADAIGDPGERVFYIQARAGTDVVTVIVEKQQVQLLSASVLELMATLEIETGEGPDEAEMDLEQPFEPRWRTGRLALGYDQAQELFTLEIEEFRPEIAAEGEGARAPRRPGGRRRGRAPACHEGADVRALASRRRGGGSRPTDLSVLRQPDGP
jgi:uncharacterized repeat protein (TIGR03847 family)